MSEQPELLLHGIDEISHPYSGWVSQRNTRIGYELIKLMSSQHGDAQRAPFERFLVGSRAMTKSELLATDVGNNYYATAVDELSHTEKSILYKPLSKCQANPPLFYTSIARFAEQARKQKLVLPGTTVFSADDLMRGYQSLCHKHFVRSKLPGLSDGNGQYKLTSELDVERLIDALEETVFENGLILEPQILHPQTISVGLAVVGKETYSFIAYQKDEVIRSYDEGLQEEKERTRYRGASVVVVKGDMGQLFQVKGLDMPTQKAVDTSVQFWEAYETIVNPLAHRLSFDYVFGRQERRDGTPGAFAGGITDITARPGGTDPALIEAMKVFQKSSAARVVAANVNLYYSSTTEPGETYVSDPPNLEIKANVTGVFAEYSL